MVEHEQVKPLAPSADRISSDEEETAALHSKKLRRRKCIRCCGCITGVLLVHVIVIVILIFTLFRVKDPSIRLNGMTMTRLELINNTKIPKPGVNMSLIADVSVKNPNIASFRYSNTTTALYYYGEVVGEVRGPPGRAKARRTVRMNVTVDIITDKLISNPNLSTEMGTGLLTMDSYSKIPGRMKLLNIIKKHVTVKMNCTFTVNITTGAIHETRKCRKKVDHLALAFSERAPTIFLVAVAHAPFHQQLSTLGRAHNSRTMKIFQSNTEFNYSWDEVSTSNWRKYGPWNEKTPHVIAVDTLSRTVDPNTGILRTERLITCKQSTPKWINSILGGQDTSLVYETSYVDPVSKKVTMTSMNMTWSDLLSVRETVVYTPSSSAPDAKTLMHQEAKITALCGGWQKIKNSIEQFTVERFQQNAAMGKEGFEMVLEMSRKVFAEQRELLRMEDLKQNSRILQEARI